MESLTDHEEYEPYYFITYKYIKNCDFPVEEDMYQIPLKIIQNIAVNIADVVFEKDKKGRVHMHCIVQLKARPSLRQLALKGYSANIKQIYNLESLNGYLKKELERPIEQIKRLKEYLF